MRHLRRFLTAALVIAAAGCAAVPQMDAEQVEAVIATELEPHLEPEPIDSVDCPGKVPVEVGAEFTCVVRTADTDFDVEVTQQDDTGEIEFAPRDAVIVTAAIEADLDTRLHEAYDQPGDILDIAVDCDEPRVRVLEVGDTFDCTVTAADSEFVERVSVVDTEGTVSYLVVD